MHKVTFGLEGGGSLDALLVHSTDLKRHGVCNLRQISSVGHRTVSGPTVLVQRVGKPELYKVAAMCSHLPLVLSDCIVALSVSSFEDAKYLEHFIHRVWLVYEEQYTGTCAKYTTVSRLRAFLDGCGFVTKVRD